MHRLEGVLFVVVLGLLVLHLLLEAGEVLALLLE